MTTLDRELVERLRELLNGAEPLPWHWQPSHLRGKTVDLKRDHWVIGSAPTLRGMALVFGNTSVNARLIVEGIAALPSLLATIARQAEELREAREALHALAEAADAVGVEYFDTDTMDLPVEAMLAATQKARALSRTKEGA